MGIVEDLLANPGLYLGIDSTVGREGQTGAAKLTITPLPGGSGVAVDYEIFNTAEPDRVRGHVEHTMVAKTHDGHTIMVIGHLHAESLAVLTETTPGTFELGDGPAPFPMKVVLSMPEPGHLVHSWWYGMPGGEAEERDVADLHRVS